MRSRHSIVLGAWFIAFGVLFLGTVNNWWQIDWPSLVILWPAILILVGIRLLLPRTEWADWTVAALILLGLAAFIATPPTIRDHLTGRRITNGSTTSSLSQSGGQTTKTLQLSIDAGATNLHAAALSASADQLYTAESHGFNLSQSFSRSGGDATASIGTMHHMNMGWWDTNRTMDLNIARTPALQLSLNTGASTCDVDLSDLNLTSLNLRGGASTSTVKLGSRSSRQTITVEGGASTVTVLVPGSAALKLSKDGGLTDDNFGELGLTKAGDTYTSPGFDAATNQITITFSGGASTIKVTRY